MRKLSEVELAKTLALSGAREFDGIWGLLVTEQSKISTPSSCWRSEGEGPVPADGRSLSESPSGLRSPCEEGEPT